MMVNLEYLLPKLRVSLIRSYFTCIGTATHLHLSFDFPRHKPIHGHLLCGLKYTNLSQTMNNAQDILWRPGHVISMVAVMLVVAVMGQENAAEDLLKFKTALASADPALADWNPSTEPCTGNWAGVLCYNGYVWGLQLDNMGLQGQIDVDALAGLQSLRTISLTHNNFQGPMPDWRKLPTLTSLYLSGNHFSGRIPDDAFNGMDFLKKVYLSNNKFSGPIPSSLASPRMVEVGLDNNQFSGGIPPFSADNIMVFDVSGNQLQGPIPPSLRKLDPSSFQGSI